MTPQRWEVWMMDMMMRMIGAGLIGLGTLVVWRRHKSAGDHRPAGKAAVVLAGSCPLGGIWLMGFALGQGQDANRLLSAVVGGAKRWLGISEPPPHVPPALSLMDHPNIARVLDAGTTDAGSPYFVMDYIRGIPFTEYCDQNKLTIRERLDLFIQVCRAIQHAHQKAIVHRDIKPSNVLVTLHDGKPVPKVIDFGVAKALNTRLTERTIYTAHMQIIGTMMYMSPEQAEMSGLDIDARSDV